MKEVNGRFINSFLTSPLLLGLFLALAITFLLTFMLSLVFEFTALTEEYLGGITLSITIISVILGGFFAATRRGAKYLFNGFGVGLLYLIIVVTISYFDGSTFEFTALAKRFSYCALSGATGGLLGAFFD